MNPTIYHRDNYFLIKLKRNTDPLPTTPEELIKSASGNWLTTLKTLKRADKALLVHKGLILAEFKVIDGFSIEYIGTDAGRIKFNNLEIVPNSKYLGKTIDTPTPNPFTVINKHDIK